jgi:hypothetical protein
MRVVYLYGPPGVGKLAVGTALAALTGFRLFHNHLTVNLATAISPRESAAWVKLIRHVRRHVFAEATREDVDLIYTGVYLGTAGRPRRSTPCSSRCAWAAAAWRSCNWSASATS